MKRIFLLLSVFFLLSTHTFAIDDDLSYRRINKLNAEIKQLLNKIENYEWKIKQNKINRAKGLKNIAQLKLSISAKRETIRQLTPQRPESDQDEMSRLSAVPPPVEAPMPAIVDNFPTEVPASKEISRPSGVYRLFKAGYTAGALEVGLDFFKPLDNSRAIFLGGAYGFGIKYNVSMASLGIMLNIKDFFVCPTLNYANYSSTISKIFGFSGNIDVGSHIGGGLAIGRKFNAYSLRLGYTSTTGVIADIGYRF